MNQQKRKSEVREFQVAHTRLSVVLEPSSACWAHGRQLRKLSIRPNTPPTTR